MPQNVVEHILCFLKTREVASMAIAFPPWQQILTEASFIRKFVQPFKDVKHHDIQNFLKELELNNYEPLKIDNYHSSVNSGHCCLCLLQPHMLCEKSDLCFCVDHRLLWGDIDLVLWQTYYFCSKETFQWPNCKCCSYEIINFSEDFIPF